MRGKLLHGCTGCTGYFGVGRAVPSEPQNERNIHAPARGSPWTARPSILFRPPAVRRPHRGTSTALLGLGLIQIAIAIGIGIDFLLSRSAGFFRFPTRRHAALDMIPGSPGTARPSMWGHVNPNLRLRHFLAHVALTPLSIDAICGMNRLLEVPGGLAVPDNLLSVRDEPLTRFCMRLSTQKAGMAGENNLPNRCVWHQGRARFPEHSGKWHPSFKTFRVRPPVAAQALSSAPSGTTSCSTYFQSATSSFLASATIPLRLLRLVPAAT